MIVPVEDVVVTGIPVLACPLRVGLVSPDLPLGEVRRVWLGCGRGELQVKVDVVVHCSILVLVD